MPADPISQRPTDEDSREPLVFSGTLMDGPDTDVLDCADINLSEEQWDELWSETSLYYLLEECAWIDKETVHEDEDRPLYSDAYFKYSVSSANLEKFKAELRDVILSKLNLSDED